MLGDSFVDLILAEHFSTDFSISPPTTTAACITVSRSDINHFLFKKSVSLHPLAPNHIYNAC